MSVSKTLLAAIGAVLLILSHSAYAAIDGLERLASGLNYPVYATHAPGDPNRLFILEKGGIIKILDLVNGGILGNFLTVAGTDAAGEGGLLGMAFHPDYQSNGLFYVYVTIDNGGIVTDGVTSPFSGHVREYGVMPGNPNLADPDSMREILNIVRPRDFHVGGWIGFNPEIGEDEPQYLYVTSGDGGPQGDPNNHAQTITNQPLGKVLRVDVDSDAFPGDSTRNYANPATNPFVGVAGDDEIWAYGVRNPWRASFDRDTGDYWIGDVGYNTREEINQLTYGSAGGANLGWRLWEGTEEYAAMPDVYPPGYVGPVYDYAHGNTPMTGNSVVGGYVYRGPDPELYGTYIFGDSWNNGNTWAFDPANPSGTVANIEGDLTPNVGTMTFPVAFGEDAVGNLYVVDYSNNWAPNTGEIYRIVTDALLAGDYDADGDVDDDDFDVWRGAYGMTGDQPADGNDDGIVNGADYTVWRDNLGESVHNPGAGSGAAVPEPAAVTMVVQLLYVLVAAARYNRTGR